MADQSPYQVLGVSEDASFEVIQAARDDLLKGLVTEEDQEKVEQAYDMILMQRLRLRKEGKIAVPDRIRYAERVVNPIPELNAKTSTRSPSWLIRYFDQPNAQEIVLPAGILGGLWGLTFLSPARELVSFALAIGILVSLYFLYRKERRLLRTVVLSLVALVIGVTVGTGIASLIAGGPRLVLGITYGVLWFVMVFFR
jgi:hypothetical protein